MYFFCSKSICNVIQTTIYSCLTYRHATTNRFSDKYKYWDRFYSKIFLVMILFATLFSFYVHKFYRQKKELDSVRNTFLSWNCKFHRELQLETERSLLTEQQSPDLGLFRHWDHLQKTCWPWTEWTPQSPCLGQCTPSQCRGHQRLQSWQTRSPF